jgi:hypothetical protein
MDMIKPTDLDMSIYPHTIFTSDDKWDPSILDKEYSRSDLDTDLLPLDLPDPRVNQYGEILNRKSEFYHASTEDSGFYEYVNTCLYKVKHGRIIHTKEHDFDHLHPNLDGQLQIASRRHWRTPPVCQGPGLLSYAQALKDAFIGHKRQPA